MTRPKTIAVDVDGVIYKAQPWAPKTKLLGELMPGCIDELKKFIDAGWDIVIHTARHPNQFDDIERELILDDVPYDRFWRGEGKPLADVYLDDRAVTFDGEWLDLCNYIELHWEPWHGDRFVRPESGSEDEELVKER